MAVEKIILEIQGKITDAQKQLKALKGEVTNVNKAVSKTEVLFNKAAVALGGFFAVSKIMQWGKAAVDVIADFEKSLSGLSAITGAVGKDLDFMARKAIEFGVELKKSAKDVVEAFQLVGSAKPDLLKNAEALAEVTKQAIILSQAARMEVSEAANMVTKALNMWGKGAKDAAKFTDILADSQKKGTAVVRQIGDALQNAGSIAASLGMTFEATNAVLQAFAKGGLDGLKAGMAFNIVIRKLATQANDDLNPSLRSMTEVLDNLNKKGYGEIRKATKLVGDEGARYLLTLIQQRNVVRELEFALGDAGVALEQARINTDNIRGATDELRASIEELILVIDEGGGVISGTIKKALEFVTLLVQGSTDKVEAAKSTRKTLGPFFKAIFGKKEERDEAIIEAGEAALGIGKAMGEKLSGIMDFLGIDSFLGITREDLERLGESTIVAGAEDVGEDAGEALGNALTKSFIERMTELEFKKFLEAIRKEGKIEPDEGSLIEAWMWGGKDPDWAKDQIEKDWDDIIENLEDKQQAAYLAELDNKERQLAISEAYARAEIEIENIKQDTKYSILTSALRAAGVVIHDSAIGQALLAVAESIISTYLTAQYAAQSQASIPIIGPILAEAARAQAITAGWINTALIAAVQIPKFFGKGGYTGDDATSFRDPHGKPLAGFVHKKEFVFDQEKTAVLRPFFEDIHHDRIDIRGLAALTRRGTITPVINNQFNAEVLEREVGKIYRKIAEEKPQRSEYETDTHIVKKIGNTTIKICK